MLRLELHGTTDVGRSRRKNEDAFSVEPDAGLAVVADGMGGHPAGDVASALAVEEVRRAWGLAPDAEPDPDRPPSPEVSGLPPGERMEEAGRRANERILDEGDDDP